MKVLGLKGEYCPTDANQLSMYKTRPTPVIVLCGSVCASIFQQTGDMDRLTNPNLRDSNSPRDTNNATARMNVPLSQLAEFDRKNKISGETFNRVTPGQPYAATGNPGRVPTVNPPGNARLFTPPIVNPGVNPVVVRPGQTTPYPGANVRNPKGVGTLPAFKDQTRANLPLSQLAAYDKKHK